MKLGTPCLLLFLTLSFETTIFAQKTTPPPKNDDDVVVRVDTERNLLLVKGSVPGPNKGLVMIRRAIKGQQATR